MAGQHIVLVAREAEQRGALKAPRLYRCRHWRVATRVASVDLRKQNGRTTTRLIANGGEDALQTQQAKKKGGGEPLYSLRQMGLTLAPAANRTRTTSALPLEAAIESAVSPP